MHAIYQFACHEYNLKYVMKSEAWRREKIGDGKRRKVKNNPCTPR